MTTTGRRTILVASALALAVAGVVVGVDLATGGPGRPAAPVAGAPAGAPGVGSTPSAAPAPAGPAGAVELFPTDGADGAGDTVREVVVDAAADWPLAGCPSAEPERGRTDLVRGTETGPEYVRDLAIAWYADATAAELAYEQLGARLAGCAAAGGSTIADTATGLGDDGVLLTLVGPSTDHERLVIQVAVTRVGSAVTLAADRSTFHDEAVPAAGDAPTTLGHAAALGEELCRVDAARC